ATAFCCIEQLTGETQVHGFFATLLGRFTQPAHGQGQAAHRTHFNGHLVVRATDAAAFHFHQRLDVVDGKSKDFDRLFAGLGLDLVEGTVDDTFGDSLLARQHHDVHELGQFDVVEFGIREDFAFGNFAATGHCCFLCVGSVEPRNDIVRGHGSPTVARHDEDGRIGAATYVSGAAHGFAPYPTARSALHVPGA